MVEKENECFVCVEDQVARETRVLLLFDGNLSDFEGVVGCRHLGQYVLDGCLCLAMPFLWLFRINCLLQVEWL